MPDDPIINYTPLPKNHPGFLNRRRYLMIILLISIFFFIGSSVFLYSKSIKDITRGWMSTGTGKNGETNNNLSADANLNKVPVTPTLTPSRINYSTSVPPTPIIKPTVAPTAKPTPTPIPRTPNPPVVTISFPSEMQNVTLTAGQHLCVVDVPGGGGPITEKRQNINDQGWSSYTAIFSTCFDPSEGLNKIQFQFKNSYGDESSVITRNFNFLRIINMTIALTGNLYRDENCNGIQDSNEGVVSTPATVNIFKMPEFYIYATVSSDGNGNFTFSKTVSETETVALQPVAVAPSGYTSNPHFQYPTVTLNSSNRSGSVNLPYVPNENHSSCQY